MISQISMHPSLAQAKLAEEMLHPTNPQLWTTPLLSQTLGPGWKPAGGSLSFPSGYKLDSFLQVPEQGLGNEVLQGIQGLVRPNELIDGIGMFCTTAEFLSVLSQPGKKHKAEVVFLTAEMATVITGILAHSLGYPALERASTVAGLVLKVGKKIVVYVHQPDITPKHAP